MENSPRFSVIIPAYNEAVGLGNLLDKMVADGYHKNFEIIIVDDGSTDGTGEIAAKFPVRVVHHSSNKGYGASLKTGIRKAGGDYVITMDSDGQHDPKYLTEISRLLLENEMVIGTRSAASHQVKNRQAGKRVIRWVGEYLVEQKLPDYNSGFRGFQRNLITGMLHIMPNGFSFSTTSTLAFLKEGYSIGTMPIDVAPRQGRSSNVRFLKDGSKTIMLILRIIMLFNPLKIFLPASLIMFTGGVAFGVYGYIVTERFSNSAIVMTILGMFLFFIGLVADQISLLNRKY
ncbi:MAG: glycosyltransferase family 2 protein [Bacteroidales bacterium]|nr:glycosyltransferase family 2 protein [Bacteroidales bacterium]